MSESEEVAAREAAPPAVSKKLNRYRWMAIVILLIGAVINYLDRGTMSIANTTIASQFHLSTVEMGLILSAFSWPYAIANLPAGWLVDKFGPRKVFGYAALTWSLFEGLTAIASSFGVMYALRVLLGLAESPFFTAGLKVGQLWFNDKERAVPVAVLNTGSQIGNALSPPILAALMLLVGWQGMFIIVGALGIVIALIWLRFYHEPAVQEILAVHGTTELRTSFQSDQHVSWGGLFKKPNMWFMIFGCFCLYYTTWTYLTWLPSYLQTNLGFSLQAMGWVASLPYLCGVLGVLVGGWIAQALSHRMSIVSSRRVPIIGGALFAAAFVIPAAFLGKNDITLVVILLSLGYFGASVPNGNIWAIAADVAPSAELVSSVGSIQNFGGYLGSAIAPVATGVILAATGNSYTLVFVIGGVMLVLSAMFYGLFRADSSKKEKAVQAA